MYLYFSKTKFTIYLNIENIIFQIVFNLCFYIKNAYKIHILHYS